MSGVSSRRKQGIFGERERARNKFSCILVRVFSSVDAGGQVLLIMSLVHLVVMTTKIHSGKTVKTSRH